MTRRIRPRPRRRGGGAGPAASRPARPRRRPRGGGAARAAAEVPAAGHAAAAVVHPGPVRRLLRRRRPGLLHRARAGRADHGGRGRHRPADGARAGPGRLRDRLGAQGARLARAGRGRSPTSPRSSSAPAPTRSRSRTRASRTPADLRGKKVGNWGFGNEFELFAGMTEAGLTPATDVTLVQQQFDMQALLSGEIDAAQAMSYNEYAQVLEAHQPGDRAALPAERLHRSSTGTTPAPRCCRTRSGPTPSGCPTRPTRTPPRSSSPRSLEGWAYCRDNVESCRDIVVAGRVDARRQPPAVAGQRGEQADLAVAGGRRGHDRRGRVGRRR